MTPGELGSPAGPGAVGSPSKCEWELVDTEPGSGVPAPRLGSRKGLVLGGGYSRLGLSFAAHLGFQKGRRLSPRLTQDNANTHCAQLSEPPCLPVLPLPSAWGHRETGFPVFPP